MAETIADLQSAISANEKLIEHQRAQIEELKTMLQKAQSSHTTQATETAKATATAPAEHSFRFLELPAELRDCIYELCLVVGTVFPRARPKYDVRYRGSTDFEKPEWQLLAISHQVREEAAKVLFSNNHFVLSYDASAASKFFFREDPEDIDRMPETRYLMGHLSFCHVRSLSITLDLRSDSGDLMDLADVAQEDVYHYENTDTLGNTTHHCSYYPDFWYVPYGFCGRLKFLQINTMNCYCPQNWHRAVESVVLTIRCQYTIEVPEVVEVLGTKTAKERAMIVAAAKSVLRRYPDHIPPMKGILRFKSVPPDDDEFLMLYIRDRDVDLEDEEIALSTPVLDDADSGNDTAEDLGGEHVGASTDNLNDVTS